MANTLNFIQYGRPASGAEADYGLISNGDSRSSVFDAGSHNVWVTTFKGVIGRSTGTNAALRFSAYTTDGSNNPATRIGDSLPATASASYTGPPPGSTIGAVVSAAVGTSDNGPTSAGIMLYSGQSYAIDVVVRSAELAHSMKAAPTGATNQYFYNRSGAASPPTSTYGSYSSSFEGQMTLWMEGWENAAPVTPATGLAPVGSVNTTASTFTADFRDLNGAYGTSSTNGINTGDQLNQYQIQVRRVSDQVLFWNAGSFNATSTEQSANAVGIAYGGTTLVRGTAYEWRIRQSDMFSAWSGWSAWTGFTPVSAGYVTLDNAPTGKINAISDSIPSSNTLLYWRGRWTHQTAAAMTQVQVRLLDGNGTLLQNGSVATGYSTASSASPGTLFTVSWANSGFSALGWGRSYQYQIQGYDGTNWSGWSAPRAFTTDAAPTIPVPTSPTGGLVSTTYPLLQATFTDADDTVATGLTGVFRVMRPDLTTVDVTPTYNTTNGQWGYQTTATQINQYGVYTWTATGYDATIYSGEGTTLAAAMFSSGATFDYEAGPVVTITSPTAGAVITTSSLTVTWSSADQVTSVLTAYESGTNTLVYRGTTTDASTRSRTITNGYLRNGHSYDLVVSVTNAAPLTGYSGVTTISVAFTPPTAVANPTITPVQITDDPFPTAIRLAWDPTSYTSPQFVEYTVTRSADGGPDAAQVVLARITSPTNVSLIDYTPVSGATYTYTIAVVILTGVDTVSSTPVILQASVNLTGTVLSLLGNGGTYRVVLLNVTDRSRARTISETAYTSLSGDKPTTIRSRVHFWNPVFTALLFGDAFASAAQRLSDLETLDIQQGVVCLRNGLGVKRFVKLVDLKITDQKPGDWYQLDVTTREENAGETGV